MIGRKNRSYKVGCLISRKNSDSSFCIFWEIDFQSKFSWTLYNLYFELVFILWGLLALGGWFGRVVVGSVLIGSVFVSRTLEREKEILKNHNLRVPLLILAKATYLAIQTVAKFRFRFRFRPNDLHAILFVVRRIGPAYQFFNQKRRRVDRIDQGLAQICPPSAGAVDQTTRVVPNGRDVHSEVWLCKPTRIAGDILIEE